MRLEQFSTMNIIHNLASLTNLHLLLRTCLINKRAKIFKIHFAIYVIVATELFKERISVLDSY